MNYDRAPQRNQIGAGGNRDIDDQLKCTRWPLIYRYRPADRYFMEMFWLSKVGFGQSSISGHGNDTRNSTKLYPFNTEGWAIAPFGGGYGNFYFLKKVNALTRSPKLEVESFWNGSPDHVDSQLSIKEEFVPMWGWKRLGYKDAFGRQSYNPIDEHYSNQGGAYPGGRDFVPNAPMDENSNRYIPTFFRPTPGSYVEDTYRVALHNRFEELLAEYKERTMISLNDPTLDRTGTMFDLVQQSASPTTLKEGEDLNRGKFFIETYYRITDEAVHDIIEEQILVSRNASESVDEDGNVLPRLYDAAIGFFGYIPLQTDPARLGAREEILKSPFRGPMTSTEKNSLLMMVGSSAWDPVDKGQNLAQFMSRDQSALPLLAQIQRRIRESLKAGIRLVFVPGVMNPDYQDLAVEKAKEGIYILPDQYKGYNIADIGPDPAVNLNSANEFTSIDSMDLLAVPDLGGHISPAADEGLPLDLIQSRESLIKLANLSLKTRAYVGNTSVGLEWLQQDGAQPWGEEVTRLDGGTIRRQLGDIADGVVEDGDGISGIGSLGDEEADQEHSREILYTQTSLYQLPRPKYDLFPTPLVSYEIDASCEIDGNLPADYRQRLDNDLIKGLLGLGIPTNDSGRRRLVGCEHDRVKYLFDFVFPLDRYASLFLIQNEMMLDARQPVASLLDPTRSSIEQMIKILMNPDAAVNDLEAPVLYEAIIQNSTSGGLDDRLAKLLKDIWPMILRAMAMAVPTLIRGQANFIDPAYQEMLKKFKENPCAMPNGMTWDSLGAFVTDAPLGVGTKNIAEGFGKQGKTRIRGPGPRRQDGFAGQCGLYGPSNISAPQDAAGSALWLTMMLLSGDFGPKAWKPMIDTVRAIYKTATNQKDGSYGKMLGPMGMLALSMPELPGEKAKDKRKDRNCGPAERDYYPRVEDKCDPGLSTVDKLELCEDIKNKD